MSTMVTPSSFHALAADASYLYAAGSTLMNGNDVALFAGKFRKSGELRSAAGLPRSVVVAS